MKCNLILSSLLLLFMASAMPAQQPTVKKVPPKPTAAVSGKDLFRQYCAVCHGADGKGAGPAAAALKSKPTDLTQISRKNGGSFPDDRIMKILKGEQDIAAHGSQDMPIWGRVFANMSSDLSLSQTRIHGLLQYLDEMQAK